MHADFAAATLQNALLSTLFTLTSTLSSTGALSALVSSIKVPFGCGGVVNREERKEPCISAESELGNIQLFSGFLTISLVHTANHRGRAQFV